MPRVSDVYKSSYLRAADLEEPLTVTIKSASIEELGEDKEEKIVVMFKELDRGLVLNRTNADYLSMMQERRHRRLGRSSRRPLCSARIVQGKTGR